MWWLFIALRTAKTKRTAKSLLIGIERITNRIRRLLSKTAKAQCF
jgi:hypothetical protein